MNTTEQLVTIGALIFVYFAVNSFSAKVGGAILILIVVIAVVKLGPQLKNAERSF